MMLESKRLIILPIENVIGALEMVQNLVQSLLLALTVMAMEKLDLIKVFLQFNKLVQSVVVMENV